MQCGHDPCYCISTTFRPPTYLENRGSLTHNFASEGSRPYSADFDEPIHKLDSKKGILYRFLPPSSCHEPQRLLARPSLLVASYFSVLAAPAVCEVCCPLVRVLVPADFNGPVHAAIILLHLWQHIIYYLKGHSLFSLARFYMLL